MKITLTIFLAFVFLGGCAQNSTMLGPALTVATTGSIPQAIITQGINLGIKNQTGKNIKEHAISSLLNKEVRNCEIVHTNKLNEIFFRSLDEIDCKFNNINYTIHF
tara:strand:- start:364 stop:681 length:318 start_codon:yes stop_codon:yes gene_type:complete